MKNQKINVPNCSICKQNKWIENTHGCCIPNYEFINNKGKHQIVKRVLRQD